MSQILNLKKPCVGSIHNDEYNQGKRLPGLHLGGQADCFVDLKPDIYDLVGTDDNCPIVMVQGVRVWVHWTMFYCEADAVFEVT